MQTVTTMESMIDVDTGLIQLPKYLKTLIQEKKQALDYIIERCMLLRLDSDQPQLN